MATVTVKGAGDTTVTIQLSSDQNAALAQTALYTVTKLVNDGVLTQQNYAGTGTLPAPQNFLGGAVVLDGSQGNVGALSAQYASAVSNATGASTIVGPDNFKSIVVLGDQAGATGNTYLNLSSQAEIYFGKGDNFLVNQDGATAYFDKGGSVLQTGLGSTTNANIVDGTTLIVTGEGLATVNASSGAAVVRGQGSSTIPVTVNGTGATSLTYLASSGAAVINPGAANVTVFSSGTGDLAGFTGSTSVFAAGATGKMTVVGGVGRFEASSVGGSELYTSTVSGSATLVGGSKADLLFSLGANQDLYAGAGSSTLVGSTNPVTVGGGRFFGSGGGQALIFGNTAGGNQFFSGAAQNTFDGRNEGALAAASVTGAANTYYDFQFGDFDQQFISDFVSGTDKLSGQLTGADSVDIQFFEANQSGNPFAGSAGSMVTFKVGGAATSQWFAFDAKVQQSDVILATKNA